MLDEIFSTGEIVLFCKPSALQLSLYSQMLQGKLFRSCLRSDGATHLVCIGALKKLCNHPSLIFTKACQAEESPDDIEEVIVLSLACLFIQNLIIILLCTAALSILVFNLFQTSMHVDVTCTLVHIYQEVCTSIKAYILQKNITRLLVNSSSKKNYE